MKFSYANHFSKLIADACIKALPENHKNFDIEFVRVAKLLGGSITDSFALKGLMIARNTEGSIKHAKKPKIALFSCPLDTNTAETKVITNLLIKK